MDTKQLTLGRNEWIMMIALSILFGGAFFFFEIGVETFQPMTFVWLRVSMASVLLLGFVLLTKRRIPMSPKVLWAFAIQGLLNNVIPFSLIGWGQVYIDGSLSSILNATTPMWTVLIVGLILPDERLNGLKIVGVVLGILGVACMIGLDALGLVGQGNVFAQFAVVLAAISYGFAGLWGRRFQALDVDPVVVAWGQLTASAIWLLPVVLFIDPVWAYWGAAPIEAWGSAVGIAVLSSAVAYILFFRILAAAGATNLSLVTFMVPISATLLGVLFLNEQIGLAHLLGVLLIGVALALIDGRLFRRKAP